MAVTTGSRWNKCDWTLLVQKLPKLAEHHQDDSLDVALVSAYLDDELVICLCCPRQIRDLAMQLLVVLCLHHQHVTCLAPFFARAV